MSGSIQHLKATFTFLLLTILHLSAFSQYFMRDVKKSNIEKKQKALAEAWYYHEEYTHALTQYEKILRITRDSTVYNFPVGLCHLATAHKYKALPYLKAAAQQCRGDNELFYYLGLAFQINHEFDDAIKCFQRYVSYLKTSNVGKGKILTEEDNDRHILEAEKSINVIESMIQHCENARYGYLHSSKMVRVINIGAPINTLFPEYNVSLFPQQSQLCYNCVRPTEDKHINELDYPEVTYFSHQVDTTWTAPMKFNSLEKAIKADGISSISHDGKTMILYMTAFNAKGRLTGDLYTSHLNSTGWSKPRRMKAPINSKSSETAGCMSSDEKTFFFSSDRPGGLGGKDIYMVTKLPNNKWSQPVNLGDKVNTSLDDDFPFISHEGNTLYFSSKGHTSFGGYDIFQSIYSANTKAWSRAENMGAPINDTYDDIQYVMASDGKTGYFCSDRKGGMGGKDIYKVIQTTPSQMPMDKPEFSIVKGKVLDEWLKVPIHAEISVTDILTNQLVGIYKTSSSTLNFVLALPFNKKYKVSVLSTKHIYKTQVLHIEDHITHAEITMDIHVKPIAIGESEVLSHVYFKPSRAELQKKSQQELDDLCKMLRINPELKMEISGHTDNVGSIEFNKRLSYNRAKAVVSYLQSKGIEQARITPKGYGMEFPIATNMNEEGRQRNRRTEFKIISVSPSFHKTPVNDKCEFLVIK